MEIIVLRGAKVLVDGEFSNVDVAIAGGRIAGVGHSLPGDIVHVDGYLLPGFIDEHIHGIYGSDIMQGPQAIGNMAARLVRHGVTSFLPTTMNASVEATRAAVDAAKAVKLAAGAGADVAGVHLEGPFLGEKYKGAQDAQYNLMPTIANYERLAGDGADIVRLITIAPELDGAKELTRALVKRGVVVSAGHTDATYEQIQDAVHSGLSQATHLFNCMSPLHHRMPGVVGAALTLDGLSPQVICDGVHLHPAAVKLAVRSGADVLLITDAMMAADLDDGVYELGGQTVYVKDGAARLGAGNLAGSTLTMDRAVRNVMDFAGVSLERASAMASTHVAKSLGLSDRGSIAQGLRADLCLLDENMQVSKTYVGGKLLFER